MCVVACDAEGRKAAERGVRTAGEARALQLSVDRMTLAADGRDLAYVTVGVVDRAGNPVPTDRREVRVEVSGAGHFRAMANGDPTSLESFCEPRMHLFSGQLTAIVGSDDRPGEILVRVTARGAEAGRAAYCGGVRRPVGAGLSGATPRQPRSPPPLLLPIDNKKGLFFSRGPCGWKKGLEPMIIYLYISMCCS